MGLLRKIFGVPEEPPPALRSWEQLLSLSVVVFGAVSRTPDLLLVKQRYRTYVEQYFPQDKKEPTTDEERFKKWEASDNWYYQQVAEKLTFIEIPSGGAGNTKAERLGKVYITGMVWLLIDEGADISASAAAIIPSVLSAFIETPRLALIQGNGHHLFVNGDMGMYMIDKIAGLRGRSLWDSAKNSGLLTKRVSYISIDLRSQNRFEV